MDTLDRNSTRAPEEPSAADSHSAHPYHSAFDGPKDAPFPLMSLPVELRLMVYEYTICETRRRLPIPDVDIYFCDVRSTLLQVSRSVRKEILPSLKRRRYQLAPCLSLCLPGPPYPRTDMSDPLFLLPHIVRLLVEERCADLRQNGPEVAISQRLPDVGLDGFVRRLRPMVGKSEYSTINHISNHPHFQTFCYRTARQLRSTRTITIRWFLPRMTGVVDLLIGAPYSEWENLYKSTHDKFPSNLRLRIVFVVLPDEAPRVRGFFENEGVRYPSFRREMWSIEIARGGLDPAID